MTARHARSARSPPPPTSLMTVSRPRYTSTMLRSLTRPAGTSSDRNCSRRRASRHWRPSTAARNARPRSSMTSRPHSSSSALRLSPVCASPLPAGGASAPFPASLPVPSPSMAASSAAAGGFALSSIEYARCSSKVTRCGCLYGCSVTALRKPSSAPAPPSCQLRRRTFARRGGSSSASKSSSSAYLVIILRMRTAVVSGAVRPPPRGPRPRSSAVSSMSTRQAHSSEAPGRSRRLLLRHSRRLALRSRRLRRSHRRIHRRRRRIRRIRRCSSWRGWVVWLWSSFLATESRAREVRPDLLNRKRGT